MHTDLVTVFEAFLRSLRGMICVCAYAGHAEPWIALEFAPSLDSRESARSHVQANYSWRLRSRDAVITSAFAEDTDVRTGLISSIVEGMELLEGAIIHDIELLSAETMDLRIHLSRGLILDVFCVIVHEDVPNYRIESGDSTWVVSERSRLSFEM